jgi:hypothetical protein
VHVPIVGPATDAQIYPFQGIQASRTFSSAEPERFRKRTMVERVYDRLKGEFGGRDIRVRGHRRNSSTK